MGRRVLGTAVLPGMFFILIGCSSSSTAPRADPPADAGVDAGDPPPDLADATISGTTFSDLYRDLFSAGGAAKCQSSSCHGSDTPPGGPTMGKTKDSLYATWTTYQYLGKPLVVPGRPDTPQSSALLEVIDPDTGFMPQLDDTIANRKLTHDEIARVKTWLQNGAPND